MSQSPYIPSPLTTPPLQSTVPDPSIVEPTTTEEYYYPSTSYLPTPLPYAISPAAPCKTTMTFPPVQGLGIGLASAPNIIPKPRRDMNFAQKDSAAAKAGIETPLADYTAQMVVWLWFSNISPPVYSPDGTLVNVNPFEVPHHPSSPFNPLQLNPSPEFTRFVRQLLRITMVSHSVTLVALLYIYRLKKRYDIAAGPGTEMRPFIASLILSNKYLDDNTYTNRTWADLTGLPIAEIGKMEQEFLKGLEYRLCVEKSDYEHWHRLLDGFIYTRSNPPAYRSRFNPDYTYSPPNNVLITPATSYIPSSHYIPSHTEFRPRSVSPVGFSPNGQPIYATPTYGYGRKRSAVDAFAGEPAPLPPIYNPVFRPPPVPTPQSVSSGLARTTSLTRQIARLPGSSGSSRGNRRGSAGSANALGWSSVPQDNLRHVAANHMAQLSHDRAAESNGAEMHEGGWDSLVAPYDQLPEAHAIPPEQLMFYTISAQPHPGQDGAPRKAILRHQQPHPYSYPPHIQPYTMAPVPPAPNIAWQGTEAMLELSPTNNYSSAVPPPAAYYPEPSYDAYYPTPPTYPPSTSHSHQRMATASEPGQFADAGPPGYAYDPVLYAAGQVMDPSQMQAHALALASTSESVYAPAPAANPNRWSTTSEEMMAYNHAYGPGSGSHVGEWRTRSEWSSPMPGYEGWRG